MNNRRNICERTFPQQFHGGDFMNTFELATKVSKEESVGILMAISIVTKKLAESIAGQNSEEKEETNASTT